MYKKNCTDRLHSINGTPLRKDQVPGSLKGDITRKVSRRSIEKEYNCVVCPELT